MSVLWHHHLRKMIWSHRIVLTPCLKPPVNDCKIGRFRLYLPSSTSYSLLRNFSSVSLYQKPTKSNLRWCRNFLEKTNGNCCSLCCVRSFSVTSSLLKKKKNSKSINVLEDENSEIDISVLDDPNFDEWRSESDIIGFMGSQANSRFDMGVLVLQPWIKWGPNKKQRTTPELMLDEAAALISTLPGVRVIHKEVVHVRSLEKKTLFGSGTLERLVSVSRSNSGISLVFISVDMLKNIHIEELQKAFGLRVVDRYSVVLGIFRNHSRTKEAKLQVALAELPYIKKRLDLRGEKERMMMMEREKRLRKILDTVARTRAHVRQNRTKLDLPTVAVVGYTNAGKTSLIHAITGDARAEGKNQLFATLDVTAHGCQLPCGLRVLFVDTVGFIQEIPTDLIASFRATLEDAICADIIIHIRDASHPDYDLQGITVEETLRSLPVPEETPVITVANKIDLGTDRKPEDLDGAHLVSSLTGQGLEDLMTDIENNILQVTGRKFWRFVLSTGSDEIRWLKNAAGVVSEEMNSDDPQLTTVVAVMTEQELAAFKRNFRR